MPLGGTVASWTGYSPTLGPLDAKTGVTAGSLQFGMSPLPYRLENTFRRTQMRPIMKAWRVLTGVVAGSNVTVTRERVKGTPAKDDPAALGGLVQMELQTVINRNTNINDVNYLVSILDELTAPSPYAVDVGGNGGGGKLGF